MREVILLRFGEIFLKGKNHRFFEKTLLNNIKNVAKKYNAVAEKIAGRYIVYDFDQNDRDELVTRLTQVFGIVSLSVAKEVDTDVDTITNICKDIKITKDTFKVEVKRADKRFGMQSFEFAAEMGGVILKNNNVLPRLAAPLKILLSSLMDIQSGMVLFLPICPRLS